MDNSNLPVINLHDFVNWVEEDPNNRAFKVEYGGYINGRKLNVWVYDMTLNESQYVISVSEINLKELAKERKIKQFEALKAEFEGAK